MKCWAALTVFSSPASPDIAGLHSLCSICERRIRSLKAELLMATLTACQHLIRLVRSIHTGLAGRGRRGGSKETVLPSNCLTDIMSWCVLSVSHEGLTDYVAGAGLSVTATDTIGCAGCRPGFVEDPHRMRLEKPQSQITITLAGRVCAPQPANGRRLMWCGDQ